MKKSLSVTCLIGSSGPNKCDGIEEKFQFNKAPQNASVDIRNECAELRETVARQQQMIQNLISELEQERNAASSAANEAMSMILRLQRDKAKIQMEARQFKTYAEEKLAHDEQEIGELEDLLNEKEEAIEVLSCDAQASKHRMVSYGITEPESAREGRFRETFPSTESRAYQDGDNDLHDIEAFGEMLRSGNKLSDLEFRISQLERNPRAIQPDCESIYTKTPRTPMHLRKFSVDYANSPHSMGKEMWPDFAADSPKLGISLKKKKFSYMHEGSDLRKVDYASEAGDDLIDRVCTIDSVYPGGKFNGMVDPAGSVGMANDEYMASPRDLEIHKLYARLHALEADRELMRQAIVSMGSDKAQMVLLKEIAQNWCREMSQARTVPVKKQKVVGKFSFMSMVKWFVSRIFFWRKPRRCKYPFGLSADEAGLLFLLDGHPQAKRMLRTTV